MATIEFDFKKGSPLWNIMSAQDILPGESASYEVCKLIYTNHPLGRRLVDGPINRALFAKRMIAVSDDVSEKAIDRFNEVWDDLRLTDIAANTTRISRIYGVSVLALLNPNGKNNDPLSPEEIRKAPEINFVVYDPMNAAGSFTNNIDPSRPDFMKLTNVMILGENFNKSRCLIQSHEQPVYLSFTESTFGYTGRSVYQRALYPLQSFLHSLLSDNLVIVKSGLLVAKIQQSGTITDRVMNRIQQMRLNMLKVAGVGNVISVMPNESIESIDLHNLNYQDQRQNILENVALSADMPAQLLKSDNLASGFGEGVEDSKQLAAYIDGIRGDMGGIFNFLDKVCMYRAWTPDFFRVLQDEDDRYRGMDFNEWFSKAVNSFSAEFPPSVPPSADETALMAERKLRALESSFTSLADRIIDEKNKRLVYDWYQREINEVNSLFKNTLELDFSCLETVQGNVYRSEETVKETTPRS